MSDEHLQSTDQFRYVDDWSGRQGVHGPFDSGCKVLIGHKLNNVEDLSSLSEQDKQKVYEVAEGVFKNALFQIDDLAGNGYLALRNGFRTLGYDTFGKPAENPNINLAHDSYLGQYMNVLLDVAGALQLEAKLGSPHVIEDTTRVCEALVFSLRGHIPADYKGEGDFTLIDVEADGHLRWLYLAATRVMLDASGIKSVDILPQPSSFAAQDVAYARAQYRELGTQGVYKELLALLKKIDSGETDYSPLQLRNLQTYLGVEVAPRHEAIATVIGSSAESH